MKKSVSFNNNDVESMCQALPRVRTRRPKAPPTCTPVDDQRTGRTPVNTGIDPMFRTDNFMMYGFKVAMCPKQGRHPWCDCPYAHPTENARRRDPRVFSYSCVECPAYRCALSLLPSFCSQANRGSRTPVPTGDHGCRNTGYCAKGDQCEYAHGVFEARLHPDSYRTVECKEGARCTRKICFFYHSEEERRVPTGLQEARAQLAAEMGPSLTDVDVDKMRSCAAPPLLAPTMSHTAPQPEALNHWDVTRAVANDILTANPSLADTMKSLSSSMTPVSSHQTMIQSVLSGTPVAQGESPSSGLLPSSASLGTGSLSRVLSGTAPLPPAGSGLMMGTETVAPCMKGANKNKALVKEVRACARVRVGSTSVNGITCS